MRFFNLFSLLALIISILTMVFLFEFIKKEQQDWYAMQNKTIELWDALNEAQLENYSDLNKLLADGEDLTTLRKKVSEQYWKMNMLIFELVENKIQCYRDHVYEEELADKLRQKRQPGLLDILRTEIKQDTLIPIDTLLRTAEEELDKMRVHEDLFAAAERKCGKL